MAVADSCGNSVSNISKTNCSINQRLPYGYLVSRTLDKLISLSDLENKSAIKTMIANGELYFISGIAGVNSDNTVRPTPETNEFGNSYVADTRVNTNIDFKIDISQCMLRNLRTWNNVNVSAWMVDVDGGVIGNLVEVEGVNYLKGQPTKFLSTKASVRTANTGEFKASMIVIQDNDQADYRIDTDFILDLDGIQDLDVTVASSSATSVVIEVQTGCNGSDITGLDANLSIKDASGVVQAPDSITDNLDGTYTFAYSTPLVAGTYTPNLSTTSYEFPASDTIYGEDPTPQTFTI